METIEQLPSSGGGQHAAPKPRDTLSGRARRTKRRSLRSLVLSTVALLGLVAPGCSGNSGLEAEDTAFSDLDLTALETTAAIGSIDAQFQVDAQGTANYQIPIVVPPGTQGVEPQLSLSYRSDSSNGTAGMGFSLAGIPMITRCPRTVAQDGAVGGVNGDANDRFCLDGQRLIVINNKAYGADASEYRTELETRSRIFAYGTCGTGPCRFVVYDKKGNKAEFGLNTDAQSLFEGSSTVRAWGMSKLSDLHGNYETVSYFSDANQLYPQEIVYTKNDALPSLSLRRVELQYETRPDTEFSFVAGTKITTNKRLSKIRTLVDDSGAPNLVREYRLAYLTSAATSRSLLDNIRECDAMGICLPATTFDYNDTAGNDYNIVTPTGLGPDGTDMYQYWLRYDHGAFLIPGDYNGDGKTDFLRQTYGGWDDDTSYSFEVYFSNGNGTFKMVEPQGAAYQDKLRFDHGVNIIPGDYDGDGLTDFIRQEKGDWDNDTSLTFQVYFSRGDGYFDIVTPSGYDYQTLMRFDYGANIIPGDYDGDGLTDFIRQEKDGWDDDTSNTFRVYFSRGNGYFDIVTPTGNEYQYNLGFDGGANILPGDFNGDGMTDFLRQEKGGWDNDTNLSFQVYLSRGNGYFDITTPTTPGWNYQEMNRFDPGCTLFPADFNGDGKTDYLRQEKAGKAADTDGTLMIHYSRGNGQFQLSGLGSYTMPWWKGEYDNLFLSDYDGDGRADILKQEKGAADDNLTDSFEVAITTGTNSFRFLHPGQNNVSGDRYQDHLRFDPGANIIPGDYNGDGKMDFIRQEKGGLDNDTTNTFNVYLAKGDKNVDSLKSVVNGMGGKVDIQYAPLTDANVYTKGTGATGNMVDLQIPKYVVQSYQETPQAGQVYDYDYHYTGLRKSTDGRGSLGFASVERTSGNVVTTSEYNQAFPLTNTVKRLTVETGTTTIVTARTYDVSTLAYPSNSTQRVLLGEETTTHFEGSASYQTKKSFEYDWLDNRVISRDFGLLNTTVDDLETCTTYLNDTSSWKLGYPSSTQVGTGCSYNGSTCSCANEIKRSDITYTATRDVASVSEYGGAFPALQTTFTYDQLGNVTLRTTPGKSSSTPIVETFGYDAAFQSFVATQTRSGDGLAESQTLEFDPRFGAISKKCDDNGKCMAQTYDGLGRKATTYLPGSSVMFLPSSSITWGTDANGMFREQRSYDDWGGLDTRFERDYLDGFGRSTHTLKQGKISNQPVEVRRTLDRRGNVITESIPHHVGETYANVQIAYDGLDRVTQMTYPTGSVTKVSYSIDNAGCNGCSVLAVTTEAFGTSKARSYSRYTDLHNKVRKQVDPEGRITQFGFDALGRKTSIVTAAGTTTMSYDGFDRVVSMSSPDRGTLTYTYDGLNGWLSSMSDGSDTISYTYDGLGRVESKTIPTESVHFTYDEPGAANGHGHLTRVAVMPTGATAPSSAQSFTYTPDGRIATSTMTIDGKTFTVASQYDPSGRLRSFTYPDGSVLERAYDVEGRLASLTMGGVTYAAYDNYTAYGQPRVVSYGNGTSTTYAYDSALRLTSLVTTGPSNTKLLDYGYTWDAVNQVQQITDRKDATRTQSFTYSAAGYLTQATGVYGTLSYAYDNAGNMTTKAGSTFTYQNNRVVSGTSFSASYDARGNRTSQTRDLVTRNFTYDLENHMREVSENGTVKNQFDYDFKGERIVKVDADGTKTLYVTPNFEVTLFTDGRRVETRYVSGPAGRIAAVSTEIPASSAMMLDFERLEATGKNIDKGSLGGLFAYAKNRLEVLCAHPKAPQGAKLAFALVLFGALSQFLRAKRLPACLAVARDRLRKLVLPGDTGYARRHPIYALAIPLVLMSFLSACVRGPVETFDKGERVTSTEQELTPGANGEGYPVAGTYWFHHNHVGSASVVTNASGVEVARAEYKPYGELVQSASPGLDIFRSKFTGKEWDKDSEVYFFEARSYDPFTGRFLSADTMLAGGPEQDASSYNPYAYAINNPIMYNDPSGHSIGAIAIGVGALVGAYFGGKATNGSWNPADWNFSRWETWVGMGVGAVVGAAVAYLGTKGTGGGIAGIALEAVAMNGLEFLSPEGSSWEEFGTGVGIDMAFGLATFGAGAAMRRVAGAGAEAVEQGARMGMRQILRGAAKELAEGALEIGLSIAMDEAMKHGVLDSAWNMAKLYFRGMSLPRHGETRGSAFQRNIAESTLRAAGANDMPGRLVYDWSDHRKESDSYTFGGAVAVF